MSESLEAEAPATLTEEVPVASPAAVVRSLGTQLREAREARGNSIADVVQVIRFSAHQIEALERDDYASLPGATSVRGLVRNYAKFLKLDPVPLLALLEPAVPVPEADVRPPTNMGEADQPGVAQKVPSRLISVAIGLVVLALAGYWYLETSGENVAVKRPVAVAPGPVSTQPTESGNSVPVAAPGATIIAANPPPAAGEAVPSPSAGGLRVEFDDRSWIEIRDASQKVLLVGEFPSGTRHNVEGKAPFQLWIGRASAVRIFMGERSIDLKPHTREEVARFSLE